DYEWVDLSATLSPGGWSWTPSGVVDVSGIIGNSVYVGFMYTSTSSDAKTWEMDEILITGEVLIGVPEPLKKNYSFRFFPNPAQDQVTLTFPDTGEKVVTLLSILGSEMQQERIAGTSCTISCTDLRPGVYFIRVTGAQGETVVKKLIKE
ncbi:MAG: T9SS type A sorting domain-containing protein, partial [Bacteroidia bacterium]|nr:T9SS type A sorting domain-containing protein [Bacteroidia bacterium]